MLLYDSLIFILTLYRAIAIGRNSGSRLLHVIIRDGKTFHFSSYTIASELGDLCIQERYIICRYKHRAVLLAILNWFQMYDLSEFIKCLVVLREYHICGFKMKSIG